MGASLLPNAKQYFVDANGNPLAGGSVYFYVPGTTTPKDTWQDSAQTILNTNPVVLDSSGDAIIYGSGVYRQIVKDSVGNTIWDQLTASGLNGATAGTIGLQILASQNASDVQALLDITAYVPSRALLKAFPVGAGIAVILTEAGRSGTFTWKTGNYSAQVAADTAEGIYIKANSTSAASGAWVRTYSGPVDISWFGPAADGVTDDTTVFTAALATMAAPFAPAMPGGTLMCPGRYALGAFTVPKNTAIVGLTPANGVSGNNSNTPFSDRPAFLLTGTITTGANTTLRNLTLLRGGITIPAQDSSAYTGTAVTHSVDDCVVEFCTIIGFNLGISAVGVQRFRHHELSIDCNNGIDTNTVADSSSIWRVHCWPYGTIQAYSAALAGGGTAAANAYRLHRSGFGIRLGVQTDNIEIDETLALGYLTNFDFTNAAAFSMGSIWSDNTGFYVNSVGVKFGAGSDRALSGTITSFGNSNNIIIQMAATNTLSVASIHVNSGTAQNIQFLGGTVHIGFLDSRNSAGAAALVGTTAGRVHIGTLIDYGNADPAVITLGVVNITYEDIKIDILDSDKAAGSSRFGGNPLTFAAIAATDPLPLQMNRDHYTVTGTGSISIISGGYAGREIVCVFTGGVTLNTGGNINVGSPLVVAAGAMKRLIYDQNTSKWFVSTAAGAI